ncbi:hypothetical protein CEXT_178171 [Caerostris extrusa]|uniref:Uncharacterized protein n=1 Tax=Caerostris extrusa TaxID=172846 RepID=A0AAV4XTS0_CAEEX|nr:hypothetical protein CEXT_178171 [Caerostris extrusa]
MIYASGVAFPRQFDGVIMDHKEKFMWCEKGRGVRFKKSQKMQHFIHLQIRLSNGSHAVLDGDNLRCWNFYRREIHSVKRRAVIRGKCVSVRENEIYK